MDRRHLEYFLAIAESGSFTRAAAALNIAQPSLSHTILMLERELGAQLFERLGRGVKLTAAGQALLEPARRTLGSFEQAQAAVRRVDDVGFGRLCVITNTLWAIEPLVQIVAEFRRAHPAVQLTVPDPQRRFDVLEAVRSGAADFGLVDGVAPTGALESRWLVDHRLVAVLPPQARPGLERATLADLIPLGLISTPHGTALRELLDEELQADGESPELAVETAHLASVVPLILAGAGAALLPEGLAATAAARGARVVPMARPRTARVHLIWRAGATTGPAEHFRMVARTLFGGEPGPEPERRPEPTRTPQPREEK
jgi:LysR family transcriptional regulator, carnitine catabolism transcriptional activator